jgi:hypothetical protein
MASSTLAFTLFSALPPELRFRIWEYATSDDAVTLRYDKDGHKIIAELHRALTLTCRESSIVMSRNASRKPFDSLNITTYFANTPLYLQCPNTTIALSALVLLRDVRILALDVSIFAWRAPSSSVLTLLCMFPNLKELNLVVGGAGTGSNRVGNSPCDFDQMLLKGILTKERVEQTVKGIYRYDRPLHGMPEKKPFEIKISWIWNAELISVGICEKDTQKRDVSR